jgi:phosphoenolpyruvate-protein kinase (PTS system EI component)
VLARLAGGTVPPPPDGPFILVRREVDPVDLIRFADAGLAGAVSVAGGANSHAAIIARGLGLPMLAGVDPAVLAAPAGRPAVLDAVAGCLIVDPAPRELAAAGAFRARANGVARAAAPARTADGQQIILLCNVASAAETRLGLAAGAAGVGLLRTEIPFTGAAGWPSEAEHRSALDPVLGLLAGRPAVVRLLDFTGDKIPPFLAGQEPGLAALLSHPRALADQLRAVLRSGRDTQLSVMVPMVRSVTELAAVRAALAEAAAGTGAALPELGMMVEIAATAAAAGTFTGASDFFSVGTNDLTSEVLGLDRADPAMTPALAADPRVLALVATVARAAQAAGVGLSVCGDAAADPAVLPLLIGLGIRRFSVGAARLPQVAEWIAAADSVACAAQASHALAAAGLAPVPDQPRRAGP